MSEIHFAGKLQIPEELQTDITYRRSQCACSVFVLIPEIFFHNETGYIQFHCVSCGKIQLHIPEALGVTIYKGMVLKIDDDAEHTGNR